MFFYRIGTLTTARLYLWVESHQFKFELPLTLIKGEVQNRDFKGQNDHEDRKNWKI